MPCLRLQQNIYLHNGRTKQNGNTCVYSYDIKRKFIMLVDYNFKWFYVFVWRLSIIKSIYSFKVFMWINISNFWNECCSFLIKSFEFNSTIPPMNHYGNNWRRHDLIHNKKNYYNNENNCISCPHNGYVPLCVNIIWNENYPNNLQLHQLNILWDDGTAVSV